MQDHLGTPLEIGDYIFGGGSSKLYIITKEDEKSEFCAYVTGLGDKTAVKMNTRNFIKISKDQLVLYFAQKGYKI